MTDRCETPFGMWAKVMRDAGFWPRPMKGKTCKIKGWQTPDPELAPGVLEGWVEEYASDNIGLVMGSPLPDCTLLGALDIDHDDYKDLGYALLNNPVSGRVGKKGAVFFVRVPAGLKLSKKIKVKSDEYAELYKNPVAEWLFTGSLCVIPPSIHPETDQPYTWLGEPIHKTPYDQLPLIGE